MPALAAGQDEEERLSGATATVVLARRDKIVVANVGDSRAVLSRRCARAPLVSLLVAVLAMLQRPIALLLLDGVCTAPSVG